MGNKKFNQKNRTLNITVDDLLNSKRLEIAVKNFSSDKMLLKAILIELGLECINVAKSAVVRRYGAAKNLDRYEIAPYLRATSPDDCSTFHIYWGLSDIEQKLYLGEVNGEITDENRAEMLAKIKSNLMGS